MSSRPSQVMVVVTNPPANAGDLRDEFQSLGGEDPLEEGIATHSSTLAWEVPWTEEPGELQSMELQQVRNNLATKDTGSFWSKLS